MKLKIKKKAKPSFKNLLRTKLMEYSASRLPNMKKQQFKGELNA